MMRQVKAMYGLVLLMIIGLLLTVASFSWGNEMEKPDTMADDSVIASEAVPDVLGLLRDLDVSTQLQTSPDIAWNQNCDKFLVVYDKRTLLDNNIWGRYVSGLGENGAGPFLMTPNAMNQLNPAVAYNEAGNNYLVVWQDDRDGNAEIYAQLWNCQKLSVNKPVRITNAKSYSVNPDVVCGYNHGHPMCWVVWEDFRDGNWEIYGQRLNSAGALVGGNIRLTNNASIQRSPAIASNPENTGCNPDGTFFVVWHDNRNSRIGNGYDIWGQQLDNVGPCGLNVAVLEGIKDQMEPDIAYGTVNDRYQVVWQDNRAGKWDIFGRMVLPNGLAATARFPISLLANSQIKPAIAYDMNTNNEFLTVWQDMSAGNYAIRGRRTSGLGAPGGIFMINNGPSDESDAAVAYGATSDRYFTVWQDAVNGIRGRAFWP